MMNYSQKIRVCMGGDEIMSRDRLEGWQGQYRRMLRWQKRALVSMQGNDGDEIYDFIYAFFQNSYHLRDWLVSDDVATKEEMKDLFSQYIELQFCRDICNATKHLQYNTASIDSQPFIAREWDIFKKEPIGFSLYSDKKRPVGELMSACVVAWDNFLSKKDLNST